MPDARLVGGWRTLWRRFSLRLQYETVGAAPWIRQFSHTLRQFSVQRTPAPRRSMWASTSVGLVPTCQLQEM